MRKNLASLLLAFMSLIPLLVSGQSSALTIEITNIRFDKGWIRIGLYNHPDQDRSAVFQEKDLAVQHPLN